MNKYLLFILFSLGWPAFFLAEEGGEIRLSLRNGGRVRELRCRYNADRMRIDRPGDLIPSPPVNLLDFKHGTLRILHPHNGTWEQGAWSGAQGFMKRTPKPRGAESALPTPAATPTPRMAPPADWPEMHNPPSGMPAGIGSGAAKTEMPVGTPGVPGGMPHFPTMPPFPMDGMGGAKPMALVAKNQTNELLGFTCRLHEAKVPREGTLELWLCDNPALPPFHLLVSELPHQHGRSEWDEQLARLLRKEKLFPFRTIFKSEEGDTLAEWKVLSIKTDGKEKDHVGLFDVPGEMHRLPTREF